MIVYFLQIIIPASWIFSVILNIPLFLIIDFDKHVDFCMEHWSSQWLSKAYSILWLFAAGIIPTMLMIVLYSRVVYSLWFKDEENNPKNTRQVGRPDAILKAEMALGTRLTS